VFVSLEGMKSPALFLIRRCVFIFLSIPKKLDYTDLEDRAIKQEYPDTGLGLRSPILCLGLE
jgi:hypothetical protein